MDKLTKIIISSLAHRDIDKIKKLLNKYLGIMDLAYSITENSMDNKKLLEIFDPNTDDTKVVKLYITDDMKGIDDITDDDKMITENREWAETLYDVAMNFNKDVPSTIKRVRTFYRNKTEKEEQEKIDNYKNRYVKELTKVLKNKKKEIDS
jgi:hypothetical protein